MKYLHEIVKKAIVDAGGQGLCLPSEDCGCGVHDLMPCGGPSENCEIAKLALDACGNEIYVRKYEGENK